MDQAASARQDSGLRMQSLSTPRRVYPAKREPGSWTKERCDKAVPRPPNDVAALHTSYNDSAKSTEKIGQCT